jgi:hypothetical protein
VDVETLSGPMAIALEGGRRIGANDAETMTLLSQAAAFYAGRGEDQGEGKTGAARVAADRMRAFSHKVATRLPDFAASKPGLFASFEHVRTMHPADRAEFLQENEEIASIFEVWLEARQQAEKLLPKVVRAGDETRGQDNVSLGLAIRQADPASRAAIEINRAEIAKEIAREKKLGVASAKSATQGARAEESGYAGGLNFLQQSGAAAGADLARNLRANERNTRVAAGFGATLATLFSGSSNAGEAVGALYAFFRELNSRTDEQTRVLEQIRDGSATGGVGRSESAAASAPLN